MIPHNQRAVCFHIFMCIQSSRDYYYGLLFLKRSLAVIHKNPAFHWLHDLHPCGLALTSATSKNICDLRLGLYDTIQTHTASNIAHSCALFCFRLHCATPELIHLFPPWTHIENNPHSTVRLQPLIESPLNKRAASVIFHSKGDKIVHFLPGGPNSPSATETLVMRLCCITRYVTPRHWLLSLFIWLDAKKGDLKGNKKPSVSPVRRKTSLLPQHKEVLHGLAGWWARQKAGLHRMRLAPDGGWRLTSSSRRGDRGLKIDRPSRRCFRKAPLDQRD